MTDQRVAVGVYPLQYGKQDYGFKNSQAACGRCPDVSGIDFITRLGMGKSGTPDRCGTGPGAIDTVGTQGSISAAGVGARRDAGVDFHLGG